VTQEKFTVDFNVHNPNHVADFSRTITAEQRIGMNDDGQSYASEDAAREAAEERWGAA
jgi:hypothetical protein